MNDDDDILTFSNWSDDKSFLLKQRIMTELKTFVGQRKNVEIKHVNSDLV